VLLEFVLRLELLPTMILATQTQTVLQTAVFSMSALVLELLPLLVPAMAMQIVPLLIACLEFASLPVRLSTQVPAIRTRTVSPAAVFSMSASPQQVLLSAMTAISTTIACLHTAVGEFALIQEQLLTMVLAT
jgi:hypothetical protein